MSMGPTQNLWSPPDSGIRRRPLHRERSIIRGHYFVLYLGNGSTELWPEDSDEVT